MSTKKIVKFKKMHENAQLPKYASDGAACMDVVAVSEGVKLEQGVSYVEYGLGFAVEVPKGYKLTIKPRSSISNKTDLVLANSPGTVDSDYRGEVMVRFKALKPTGSRRYKIGDRIAQIELEEVIPFEFKEVAKLSETDRGEGGFGSTGS